jgi:futalosine hydrolase
LDRGARDRAPKRSNVLILIVCAVPAELRGLAARDGVEVLACGVGPIEAAAETARMLALDRFDAVINAGIAGVFRGRGAIGDGIVVREERLANLGLEGGASLVLPDGAHLVDTVAASESLLERCRDLPYRTGRGLTVTQVTTTDATAAAHARAYDPDVESMEGFAVLRAAAIAGVPALEVRGISNYVGDRAKSEWDFRAGSTAAVAALEAILMRLTAAV